MLHVRRTMVRKSSKPSSDADASLRSDVYMPI